MTGRLEWPDPTPDGPTPEEEARIDAERECQRCDGLGRVEVFYCKGVCECGHCPELEDCPECCEQEPPPREEWPSVMDGAATPFADNH